MNDVEMGTAGGPNPQQQPVFAGRSFSGTLAIIVVTVTFSVIFIIGYFSFSTTAKTIERYYSYSDSAMTSKILRADTGRTCVSGLINEYFIIKGYKDQFIFVASRYQILYFCCTLLLIVGTILLAIAGSSIVKSGWDKSSALQRTYFITFFFFTTFCGSIPRVFDHEENARKNITKYFILSNLQGDIYNVVAVSPKLSPDNVDSIQCVVFNAVNQNLKNNRDLFIDIKAEDIPKSLDPIKSLPSASPVEIKEKPGK